MDRGQSLIIPHLFDDTNYAYWKVRMRVFLQFLARFSDPDRSFNRKKERFKGFEVELGSNHDNVIINLIIILNIYKNIKLIKK